MSEDFFEKIQNHYNSDLPFVVYRKPNETEVKTWLQKDAILHKISDFTENGFVFSPFDTTEKSVLIPFSDSIFLSTNFSVSDQNNLGSEGLINAIAHKLKHIQLVEKAIVAIQNQKLQKVVISRCETISLETPDPINSFKKLLNGNGNAFVYCWYHPKEGLWLGATPEILLKIEGKRLTTMSLAGTQKYNGTEKVVWQDKEKEEQKIVTDFITDNLESFMDTMNISTVQTVKAGNVLHLKTQISAILKSDGLNLNQLLQKLHPTPAVCGFPMQEAKEFILKHENYNREFYTGFLGELNFKEKKSRNSNRHNVENDAYSTIKNVTNLYVNLRCMQLQTNQALIYVGGGITKDSIPEKEWEETVSKSHIIKSIL